MKAFLRFVVKIFAVPLATLIGNWIGGQARAYLTGEQVQAIQYKYTTQKGRTITNTPVATKFFPGMLVSMLGKPRWAFAFMGGLLAGGLVPDHFEHFWLELVIERGILDRIPEKE
jgi:hypothetical protein